ncbi:MAG: GtrA family protein [Nitrosomonadales bacterium]|nr:GtrA family protein [Nitrosomonadales bacterium]
MSDWRKQRLIQFLGVGVLNTLVGYGIYAALVSIDIPYLLALLSATIAGVIFNYFSFGRMVFKARGGWFVFRKFVAAYAVVYVINAALLSILTEGAYLNVYLAQGVCILPSVAMSWLLMNYWVYRIGL